MMQFEEPLIDESTLAQRLSVPLKSLQNRRSRGDIELPFIRIGKRQRRYHWPTVLEFLQHRSIMEQKRKQPVHDLVPIDVPGRRGRPRKPV